LRRARRRIVYEPPTPLELMKSAESELVDANREVLVLEGYLVHRVFDWQEARSHRRIARFYRWLARGACKVNACSCMTDKVDDRIPEGFHLNPKEYLWFAKEEARMNSRRLDELYEGTLKDLRESDTYVIKEIA
jgi:hypothetical protein